jgi:hypothetical protein
LQTLVAEELDRGEKIVWLAQPVPRSGLPCAAWFPVFFAIPWTLFALFWMAGAAGLLDGAFSGQGGQPNWGRAAFALFGLPFVLIGLVMFCIPFWMKRRLRQAAARTVYVITDRRAILFDGGYAGDRGLGAMAAGWLARWLKGTQIRSFGPDQLKELQRIQREDGSGDIILQTSTTRDAQGNLYPVRVGFLSIPDVKSVEDMLKRLAGQPRE